jgi:hypothetical protein
MVTIANKVRRLNDEEKLMLAIKVVAHANLALIIGHGLSVTM